MNETITKEPKQNTKLAKLDSIKAEYDLLDNEITYIKHNAKTLNAHSLFNEQNYLIKKTDEICKKYGVFFDLDDDNADASGGLCHLETTDGMLTYLSDDIDNYSDDTTDGKIARENDKQTKAMVKKYPKCIWYMFDNVDDINDPTLAKPTNVIDIYHNLEDNMTFDYNSLKYSAIIKGLNSILNKDFTDNEGALKPIISVEEQVKLMKSVSSSKWYQVLLDYALIRNSFFTKAQLIKHIKQDMISDIKNNFFDVNSYKQSAKSIKYLLNYSNAKYINPNGINDDGSIITNTIDRDLVIKELINGIKDFLPVNFDEAKINSIEDFSKQGSNIKAFL